MDRLDAWKTKDESIGQRVKRLQTLFMMKFRVIYLEAGGVIRVHCDDGSVWLIGPDDSRIQIEATNS